jgi:hypothetical protein
VVDIFASAEEAWSSVCGSLGGKVVNTRFVVLERRFERRFEDVELVGKVASAARKILFTCLGSRC